MATVVQLADHYRKQPTPKRQPVALGQPDVSVIIPAFNEEDGLGAVLAKLFHVLDDRHEVIVVDDGSSDSTREVALGFPCTVLSHARNLGKGAALQTGIDAAQAERVIFIDADDSYPVHDIPSLGEKLLEFDLVFGERDTGRDNIPFFNRFGNRLIAGMLRVLYGFKGTDPLTGLYGIHKEHFCNMQIRSSGFAIEAEIALKAARMGLTVDGLPITYQERLGTSKLRAVHDGYRICQTILSMLTMYSPTTLFVLPGAALFLASSLAFALLLATPIAVGSLLFETNTLLAMGMLSLAGFQFATLGVALHAYGLMHKHTKPDRLAMSGLKLLTSPYGLAAAVLALAVAALISAVNVLDWTGSGFGAFSDTSSLFLGAYLGIWGLQLLLAALFLSALLDDLKVPEREPVRLRTAFPAEDAARVA